MEVGSKNLEAGAIGWVDSRTISNLVDKAKELSLNYLFLDQLVTALSQIQPAVEVLEQQQTMSKGVEGWLGQLKETAYDAEDLLDEYQYHVIRAKVSGIALSPIRSIKKLLFLRKDDVRDASKRLQNLLRRLGHISESSQTLVSWVNLLTLANPVQPCRLVTSSVPADDAMIGRNAEYQWLVERMIGSAFNCSSRDPISSILAIVGMGGIGKTTLAQAAFNDCTVAEHFEIKIWICVSQKLDVVDLTREMLSCVDGKPRRGGDLSFSAFQQELKSRVTSKRFLIVLDDVWLENEYSNFRENFMQMLAPLRYGQPTSRILVTTRQNSVVKLLNVRDSFFLDRLTDTDEWSLLKRYALGENNQNSRDNSDLDMIGLEITSLLNGYPLAAKVTGHMLRGMKPIQQIWEDVLSKDLHTIIAATVLPSFARLPKYLQRCFALCTIFPRSWRFNCMELVQMWMALGFIEPRGAANKSLEDLGLEYIEELVNNSLFQPLNQDQTTCYHMNGMFYDLAGFISRKECMRVEGNHPETVLPTVRHLSVAITTSSSLLKDLPYLKGLRTLVLEQHHSLDYEEALLPRLTSLRVLDLSRSDVACLPETLGQLIHLRYLAISKNMKILPLSTSKLLNLQTLRAPQEGMLEMLPRGINRLIKLRHLDINTKHIAGISGIGRMVSLSCSLEFHIKNDKGHKLEELKNLNHAGPKLFISCLENVRAKEESCKAELIHKKRVKDLVLVWGNQGRVLPDDAQVEVLEGLQPHSNLEKLHIRSFQGQASPRWLREELLNNLKSLYLIKCRRWKELPPFGQLHALEVLHLRELDAVEQVGPDFYGKSEKAFPNLHELEFYSMPEWRVWSSGGNSRSFPSLKILRISLCPKLVQVPPVPAAVKNLEFRENLFITHLVLRPFGSSHVSVETSSLTIFGVLLHDEHVKAIAVLTISQCKQRVEDYFISLFYRALSSLKQLHIMQSEITDVGLSFLLCNLNSLMALRVMACPRIKSIALVGKQSSLALQELRIEGCEMLSSLAAVENTPFLQTLEVVRCPKFTLASLPPNLKHLSSLKHFTITHCPGFRSLPDGGFPSSLKSFRLVGCDQNLTRSLLLRKGTDYPKISFIPDVVIQ